MSTTPERIFVRAVEADNSTVNFYPIEGQGLDRKKEVIASIHLEDIKDGMVYLATKIKRTASGMFICNNLIQVTEDTGVILDSYQNDEQKKACVAYKKFLKDRTDESTTEEGVKKPKVISLLTQLQGDKKLAPPTIENDGWYVDKDLWYYLLRSIKRRKNMLLIGASGAGKTELAMFLADRIKKNLDIFDMAVANPYKTFCGTLQADDGSTYFRRARFSQAIETDSMILLDELSRAAPSANNIFLPMLDSRRTLYMEEALDDTERQIKVNPDCMFWATANIGLEFVGTNMLDHALMNRFQMAEVYYPPKAKESELLQKRCGITKMQADTLASIAETIRQDSGLSRDISTRQLIEIGEAMNDGYDMIKAFEFTALVQFDGGQDSNGERSTVKSILQKF